MNSQHRFRTNCAACAQKLQHHTEYNSSPTRNRPSTPTPKPKKPKAPPIVKSPTRIPTPGRVTPVLDRGRMGSPVPDSPSRIPIPKRLISRASIPDNPIQAATELLPESHSTNNELHSKEECNGIIVETFVQDSDELEHSVDQTEFDIKKRLNFDEGEQVNTVKVDQELNSTSNPFLVTGQHLSVSPCPSETSLDLKSPKEIDYEGLSRKRIYRQKNLELYKDLGALQTVLLDTFDHLKAVHVKLQSMNSSVITQEFATTKVDYISTARDIYDLSNNIVSSWTPVAVQCSDKSLSVELLQGLKKVELLAAQLRPLTNQKQMDSHDVDAAGALVCNSENLVTTTTRALSSLEAAKVRLGSQ